jgi:tetratricopeptide (TPR) repeat protein
MSRPGGGGTGFNPGGIDRPTTLPGNVNRPNIGGNGNFNRPTTLPGNVNRPNIGNNTNINRPTNINNANFNRPTNINNITNINNTRINNISGGYGGGWAGRNPYWGYHSGWQHGSWNYHYPNYNWGYFGAGLATGLGVWALSSSLSNWGYSSYYNPYYAQPAVVYQQPTTVVQQVPYPVYDYSQPINVQAPPPEQSVADTAVATFDAAREAFKQGDYATALTKTNEALSKLPNDPTLHEFRSLIFFAQKQYDQAAAALYPVLSAGPGWDWTTMVGLYPSVDVYTAQLRALQDDSKQRPDVAANHFLLAYHYLTQGYPENARAELAQVVKLQPNDQLSKRMLAQLTPADETPPATPTPAPATAGAPAAAPAPVASGPPGTLTGTWTASPTKDTTIALTLTDDGFTWKVTDKSGPRTLIGTKTIGDDILTLASNEGNPLVGKVTWIDPTHFNFKALGGGPDDPGLSFAKTGG